MTREERENALHCLGVMIDEEVCEECNLYGTTGTEHCQADCVRAAIEALKQEPKTKNDLGVDCISRQAVLDIAKASKSNWIDNSILFKRVNELPSVTPQEPILDKIDEIITDALDKSTDQKESQTLRWVLDKISEVM